MKNYSVKNINIIIKETEVMEFKPRSSDSRMEILPFALKSKDAKE